MRSSIERQFYRLNLICSEYDTGKVLLNILIIFFIGIIIQNAPIIKIINFLLVKIVQKEVVHPVQSLLWNLEETVKRTAQENECVGRVKELCCKNGFKSSSPSGWQIEHLELLDFTWKWDYFLRFAAKNTRLRGRKDFLGVLVLRKLDARNWSVSNLLCFNVDRV